MKVDIHELYKDMIG